MSRPAFKAERFLTAPDLRKEFFPGRSARWVTDKIKHGAFGDVARDGGGWLVPESGVLEYLERRRVSPAEAEAAVRPEQRDNLVQFRGGE